MCLGIPGRIERISDGGDATALPTGEVSFGGTVRRVCLAFVPDAGVGDYVIVHVGFAISRIEEAQAMRIFDTLAELGELEPPP